MNGQYLNGVGTLAILAFKVLVVSMGIVQEVVQETRQIPCPPVLTATVHTLTGFFHVAASAGDGLKISKNRAESSKGPQPSRIYSRIWIKLISHPKEVQQLIEVAHEIERLLGFEVKRLPVPNELLDVWVIGAMGKELM